MEGRGEWIRHLKNRTIESTQSKKQREDRWGGKRDPGTYETLTKDLKIHAIRMPKEVEKESRLEKALEEMMAENFPTVAKDINLQSQAEWMLYRVNTKKSTPRNKGKVLQTKDKQFKAWMEKIILSIGRKQFQMVRLLIRKMRQEDAGHFSSAGRRELSGQNPISSQIVLQEWKGNQDILRWGKVKRFCHWHKYPNRIAKRISLNRK